MGGSELTQYQKLGLSVTLTWRCFQRVAGGNPDKVHEVSNQGIHFEVR